jgi:uncharacterized membrane protein
MAVRGFIVIYISYFMIKGTDKNEKIAPNRPLVNTMVIRSILGNINAFCMFSSVLLTDIYIVTIIQNTVPIFTIILSYIFLGEEITVKKIVCILVGILGIILIVDPNVLLLNFKVEDSSRNKLIGCLLMILFAFVSATVKIILKKSTLSSRHVQPSPQQPLPRSRQYRLRVRGDYFYQKRVRILKFRKNEIYGGRWNPWNLPPALHCHQSPVRKGHHCQYVRNTRRGVWICG